MDHKYHTLVKQLNDNFIEIESKNPVLSLYSGEADYEPIDFKFAYTLNSDDLSSITAVLTSATHEENIIDDLSTENYSIVNREKIYSAIVDNANQIAEDKLKEPFIENLFQLIYNSDFEFGYSNPAEKYVIEALERYGPQAKQWINDIYNNCFHDNFIITSILRIIAHIDYKQIKPQGVTIAASAIFHDNTEICEYGIRCFENWEQPENLKILRNIAQPSELWLQNYLSDVIEELEIKKEEYKNALFC